MTAQKFEDAIERIDAINARDPNITQIDDQNQPDALVYAKRMTQTLKQLYPDASTALKLAARAQHIERWAVPRSDFPDGRAGYHAWRNTLKRRHAATASDVLAQAGFDKQTVERVADLIAKRNLANDQEAQALEDVACIVFFNHYAMNFAQKHEADKVAHIVKKTLLKMSDHGLKHVRSLALPEPLEGLVKSAAQEI